MNENVTVKSIIEEAKKETLNYVRENAKKRVITKLKELNQAKKIVANIERELEDLTIELEQELG